MRSGSDHATGGVVRGSTSARRRKTAVWAASVPAILPVLLPATVATTAVVWSARPAHADSLWNISGAGDFNVAANGTRAWSPAASTPT